LPFTPTGRGKEKMLTVDEILAITESLKGVVMIIGEPDTGKSYLAYELLRRARLSGREASLIDLDVGQQNLAYPGTIACTRKDYSDPLSFEKMKFLGTINPIVCPDEIIFYARHLLEYCADCDLTIVDTSGLVGGEGGRLLKTKKIKALAPDLILAIQRANELEHILEEVKGLNVMRVFPSSFVLTKTRETRIRKRAEKLLSYFSRPLNRFAMRLKSVKLKTPREGLRYSQGRVIGLDAGIETISLGILEHINGERIYFLSPLEEERVREISGIVIGDRGLDADFRIS
jgi:polynucleotide 5'-hydroxyl-kinase GRC3/NOL9